MLRRRRRNPVGNYCFYTTDRIAPSLAEEDLKSDRKRDWLSLGCLPCLMDALATYPRAFNPLPFVAANLRYRSGIFFSVDGVVIDAAYFAADSKRLLDSQPASSCHFAPRALSTAASA